MRRICAIFLLILLLAGCKTVQEIRPDTIVDIPLDPTRPADETAGAETDPTAEEPTRLPAPEIPTVPETTPEDTTPSRSYDTGNLDAAVAASVNAFRRENGLPALILDPRLCRIAAVRAGEIAALWSESRSNGAAGITVLDEYGYGYTRAAEVLYFGTGSAEDVMAQWMAAARTKERLLTDAAVIGVGCCTAPDGTVYVAALIVG